MPPRSRWLPERPTADPAGPGLAVVVLGLGSALAWGAGDFGGGWAGRRAPVLGIGIGVDAIGLIVMLVVLLAVAGIVGLYSGLASGGWASSPR